MTKENKKFGRRDFLLGGGSSLLLASTLSTPALSKNIRRLNMVTTWPKNLPGLGTSPERIAKRIRRKFYRFSWLQSFACFH